MKCEKNRREFISWASKIEHEWNGPLEILAVLKKEEILGKICFSEKVFYGEQ